ncbi:MAG TPA: MarR family transcriptional regulator [Tepidisphaeraceae bacterium]|nr:MarR family transcriptional regulator [Tepidisphaeraceae bacterium]
MDAFRRIVQALRLGGQSSQRRFGLSAAQMFVLQQLSHGRATSLNELAARTFTHQSSVSVVVHRLVDLGLIARNTAKNDARRLVLSLTPSGRKLVRSAPQATQEKLIDALHRLPASQRSQLAQLLRHVADDAAGETARPALFFEEGSQHPKRRKHGSRR